MPVQPTAEGEHHVEAVVLRAFHAFTTDNHENLTPHGQGSVQPKSPRPAGCPAVELG